MTPGAVLRYPDFKFPDGQIRDKLMVVLAPPQNDQVMVALTTSQQHQRSLKDGCHDSPFETVFLFNANQGGFPTITWVVLKPRLMTESRLAKRISAGIVTKLHELKDTDLRAVLNCLRKSEDASPYHLSLIK